MPYSFKALLMPLLCCLLQAPVLAQTPSEAPSETLPETIPEALPAPESSAPAADLPVPAELPESAASPVRYPRLHAQAEFGPLGVLSHQIQFSQNNTYFDYRESGGQDNLFAVGRLSLDLALDPNHSLVFMYQPLSLVSRAVLDQDMRQDNVLFTQGTPMRFTYNFPFFRASWLYDFDPDPFTELAAGVSLQLRDATIEFESLDGKQLVSQRDVGPVPVLKFRSRQRLNELWWWGAEVDGFYAPISVLNGSTNEVIGAILDAQLQFGMDIDGRYFPYLGLRYLGGGSVGTSKDLEALGDGYSQNWLHFLALSVGVRALVF